MKLEVRRTEFKSQLSYVSLGKTLGVSVPDNNYYTVNVSACLLCARYFIHIGYLFNFS